MQKSNSYTNKIVATSEYFKNWNIFFEKQKIMDNAEYLLGFQECIIFNGFMETFGIVQNLKELTVERLNLFTRFVEAFEKLSKIEKTSTLLSMHVVATRKFFEKNIKKEERNILSNFVSNFKSLCDNYDEAAKLYTLQDYEEMSLDKFLADDGSEEMFTSVILVADRAEKPIEIAPTTNSPKIDKPAQKTKFSFFGFIAKKFHL